MEKPDFSPLSRQALHTTINTGYNRYSIQSDICLLYSLKILNRQFYYFIHTDIFYNIDDMLR